MTAADQDADFEAHLANAYLTPAAAERPDLAAAIVSRVQRADRRRRAVIAISGLTGAAIATIAVATTGLVDPASLRAVVLLASSQAAVAALGLTLMSLAATRHAWHEV